MKLCAEVLVTLHVDSTSMETDKGWVFSFYFILYFLDASYKDKKDSEDLLLPQTDTQLYHIILLHLEKCFSLI